jgi:hypothetical protein
VQPAFLVGEQYNTAALVQTIPLSKEEKSEK